MMTVTRKKLNEQISVKQNAESNSKTIKIHYSKINPY